jgi:hypothetical protein
MEPSPAVAFSGTGEYPEAAPNRGGSAVFPLRMLLPFVALGGTGPATSASWSTA